MKQAVRRHLRRWFDDIASVEGTKHGLAATVRRVETNDGVVAVKYGAGASLLVEAHVLRQLEQAAISTPPLYAVAIKPPIVVTPWSDGAWYSEIDERSQRNACWSLGKALSILHNSHTFEGSCGDLRIHDEVNVGRSGWHHLTCPSTDWSAYITQYAEHVLDDCPSWATGLGTEIVNEVDEAALSAPDLSLAHGDIVMSNVHFNDDGAVHRLFDFESARVYPSVAEKWIVAERTRWMAQKDGLPPQTQRDAFIEGYEAGPTSTAATRTERRVYQLIGVLKAMRDAGVRKDEVERAQRPEQMQRAQQLLDAVSDE